MIKKLHLHNNMKVEKFLLKFANTRLGDRFKLIKMSEFEAITLNEIYDRVSRLNEEMRPKRIEQNKLIKMAEDFWDKIKLT